MDISSSEQASTAMIVHDDGRVELRDVGCISGSSLYNHDLAPVAVADRSWSTYNYAALWVSMSACIPTYMLASGLMASGMNWWQAVGTILLGNIIVLIPILLNSHPGTKYGIPFPVFARASYGTLGSNLPALMRAVVACGWFGIQSWIGGSALNTFFASLIPGWSTMLSGSFGGHPATQWLSFLIFWTLNILIIYKGINMLKKVQAFCAPFILVMMTLLLIWIVSKAQGFGHVISEPGKFNTISSFLPLFIPSLTAIIGFWATLSLNMPDFTRFGHSQREQTIGQVIALPTAMTIFSAMGVFITSAAMILYPNVPMSTLWDPVKLIGLFDNTAIIAISMFTVALATLTVNIAANVVSPANDFANAFPRWINFKTGGLVTGVFGLLMQPWRFLDDPNGYIFQWLLGYSGGLGSIAGVLICDYWLLRHRKLELADLYLHQGQYRYTNGWNWNAVIATILGCLAAWVGALSPSLRIFYDYAWFVGLFVSGAVYYALMAKDAAENPATSL